MKMIFYLEIIYDPVIFMFLYAQQILYDIMSYFFITVTFGFLKT